MRIRLQKFEIIKWIIGVILIGGIGLLIWLFIGGVVDVFFLRDTKIYHWMVVFSSMAFLSGILIRGFFSINADVEVWSMGDHELAARKGALEDEQARRKG